MQFDIRPRRGGKTHALVKAVGHNPNAAIICPTAMMCDWIRRDYPDLQCRLISWQNRSMLLGMGHMTPDVCVDNVDMILAHELYGRIMCVTATGHELLDPRLQLEEGL